MNTKIYKTCDSDLYDIACKSADIIKQGGIVALPTETVYGLAANAFDVSAVEKLYTAKNRPPLKPISLCVGSLEQAEQVAVFDEKARGLFGAFMPGPITIVLPKKSCVPDIVTAGGDTVGIRVPDHKLVSLVTALCGVPLALTSANLSGMPSPKSGSEVTETLSGRVDVIIDGGVVDIGTESTIVSLSPTPRVLREGAIPKEALNKYLDF